MVKTYSGSNYNELTPGDKNRFKFVHRLDMDNAVCLISRITRDSVNCRQIIRTKNSNSMGIKDHGTKLHSIDIDKELTSNSNSKVLTITKFLAKRQLNDIWTFESAISQLICVDLMSINQILKSIPMQRLFKKEFNEDLNSKNFNQIRKCVTNHAGVIKGIYKNEIQKHLETKSAVISFDEWTSSALIQLVNIIVHFGSSNFNLGVVEVISESANAESLSEIIFGHLQEFGLTRECIKVLVADGAAVNSKISRMSNIPIAKCFNHGVQLAILDTFYKKSQQLLDFENDDRIGSESSEPNSKRIMLEDGDDLSSGESTEDSSAEESNSSQEDLNVSESLPTTFSLVDGENIELLGLIKKVRGMMKILRRPKIMRILSQYSNLKPKIDCKTRWTSLGSMIERFFQIFEAIQKTCIDVRLNCDFHQRELEKLNDIKEIIGAGSDLIKTLSFEKANLNTADLATSVAISKLSKLPERSLGRRFSTNLTRRFIERRTILSDCLAFLIQFKINQSENLFFTSPSIDLLEKYYCHFCKSESHIPNQPNICQGTLVEQSMQIDLRSNDEGSIRNDTDFPALIQNFLSTRHLSPELTRFAECLMCVPATSTENERSFSLTGQIVSPRRSKMGSDLLGDILFINKFYSTCFNEK